MTLLVAIEGWNRNEDPNNTLASSGTTKGIHIPSSNSPPPTSPQNEDQRERSRLAGSIAGASNALSMMPHRGLLTPDANALPAAAVVCVLATLPARGEGS